MKINTKCIKIKQPIGDMYLVKLRADFVIDISSVDTRKVYNYNNENYVNIENQTYSGIQRKLEPDRVNAISEYCKTYEAMFPTPIILSAPSKYFKLTELSENEYEIDIPDYNFSDEKIKFCSIIDGQHRLEGIKKSGKASKFELIVEFAFDTDPSRDAYLFSIINGNQKAVSKSLIYDLYDLSKSRTVEKLCNKVMRFLNTDKSSFLRGNIKMLGYIDEFSPFGIVSQARMIDELKKLITDNSNRDNYDIEFGRELKDLIQEKEINVFDEENLKSLKKVKINKYVFRNYFIEENDEEIINLNIEFFNHWLVIIKETKEEFDYKNDSFLEKSLGLSVGYRVMQLLYSNNMFENNNDSEINISFENLTKVLKDTFYEFFNLELYLRKYPTGDDGMSILFMDLVKIMYKKKLISDEFLSAFLPKARYLLLINSDDKRE